MAKTDESKSVQEFFYHAPEASSVQLVGDFTHWKTNPINLAKQADGNWKASSVRLSTAAPGTMISTSPPTRNSPIAEVA